MEDKQKTVKQEKHNVEDQTVSKSEYDTLVKEMEKLKQKLPKELTDEEKAIQKKEKELFDKEVYLTLKENGLESFKDIIKVNNYEELKEVIQKLTKIVNEIKLSTGYIPENHKKDEEYNIFAKKKDTKNMIATKLSKILN